MVEQDGSNEACRNPYRDLPPAQPTTKRAQSFLCARFVYSRQWLSAAPGLGTSRAYILSLRQTTAKGLCCSVAEAMLCAAPESSGAGVSPIAASHAPTSSGQTTMARSFNYPSDLAGNFCYTEPAAYFLTD